MKITRVKVTPTTAYVDAGGSIDGISTFDNTKLVAINTCPLWGIVRYTHHKTFRGHGRAMALEAGGAAHEVFAAHRLYYFREYGAEFYNERTENIRAVTDAHGRRIFGQSRYREMVDAVDDKEDFRTRCNQFSLTALYNCGFYDDPADRRRTTTNIEEMCMAYMDKFDWKSRLPVWRPEDDFLGIEIPVDVVVEIDYVNQESITEVCDVIRIRFIGKADGVHYIDREMSDIRVHENKTASRLGDAWSMSWETNHQPTGYMVALSAMTNLNINSGEIIGTCLPLPRGYTINGIERVIARRKKWQIEEWFQWLLHTVMMHEQYKHAPLDAPMYTHSCNRYFRPCSFVPLCATEPEERQVMFDEMEVEEWNPLHGQEITDE